MQKTYHTSHKLNQSDNHILQALTTEVNQAFRTALAWICKENKVLLSKDKTITSLTPALKTKLQQKTGLNSRYINSINLSLKGLLESYLTNQASYLEDLKKKSQREQRFAQELKDKQNKILKNYPQLKVNFNLIRQQAQDYQQYLIRQTKLKNKSKVKEFIFVLPAEQLSFFHGVKQLSSKEEIQKLKQSWQSKPACIDHLVFNQVQRLGKLLHQSWIAQRAIRHLQQKIQAMEQDMAQHRFRICLGGKTLLRARQAVMNASQRKAWQRQWHDARNHVLFVSGCAEEMASNQNCQATVKESGLFDIRLNLPKDWAEKNHIHQSHIVFEDVNFHRYNSILKSALEGHKVWIQVLSKAEKEHIKAQKETCFELKKNLFALQKSAKKEHDKKEQESLEQQVADLEEKIKQLESRIAELSKIELTEQEAQEIKNKNQVNKNNEISIRQKRMGQPISYKFVQYTDTRSSKYGQWSIQFSIEESEKNIITDKSWGMFGIDLNEHHLSVSETDGAGNLIQSFNVYLNPQTYTPQETEYHQQNPLKQLRLINSNDHQTYFYPIRAHEFKWAEKPDTQALRNQTISSDKMAILLGKALTLVTDMAQRVGKPISIEKLDFSAKKKALNKTRQLTGQIFNYNRMISSLSYSRYQSILVSQCASKGIELIQVNPAYSSLMGLINHTKDKGLSIHMAASYVIAQRGLNASSKKTLEQTLDAPRLIRDESNPTDLMVFHASGQVIRLPFIVNKKASPVTCVQTWGMINQQMRGWKKAFYRKKTSPAQKTFSEQDMNLEDIFDDSEGASPPYIPGGLYSSC